MTDTVVPDTMKGGYAVGPGGERLGSPVRPDGNMVVALTPDWIPPGSVPLPHITPPAASGTTIKDGSFTATRRPPLVAVTYHSAGSSITHVAIGWLVGQSDTHCRVASDLVLFRDGALKRDVCVNSDDIPKAGIVGMLDIFADGTGQMFAQWFGSGTTSPTLQSGAV